jgi:hypothetical protein
VELRWMSDLKGELIYKRYANLKIVELPLFSQGVKGLDRLQEVAKILFQ